MGRKRILAVCVSAAIVASAVLAMPGTGVSAGEATHQVLKTSRLPQLVPARAFFASRLQTWAYTISPDGRRLAWFERRFRRIRLHIRDIDDGTEWTIRLRRPGRGLRWAHDNRHLMFLRDRRGDENHRLFVVDAESPDAPPRIAPRIRAMLLTGSSTAGDGRSRATAALSTGIGRSMFIRPAAVLGSRCRGAPSTLGIPSRFPRRRARMVGDSPRWVVTSPPSFGSTSPPVARRSSTVIPMSTSPASGSIARATDY